MLDRLLRKFERRAGLEEGDRQFLLAQTNRLHRFQARFDLLKQGEQAKYIYILVQGWALRYKYLEDGRRQIISLFVPGDVCDPMIFFAAKASHAVGSLTPLTAARYTRAEIEAAITQRSNLAGAFLLDMAVAAEIQREWAVSLGCRTAIQRMAHFFCEISYRLGVVGLADGMECDLPLTQNDLADALGLSTVHVNRTLQDLRATGLVEVRSKRLKVHDRLALQELAIFDPSYLELQSAPVTAEEPKAHD